MVAGENYFQVPQDMSLLFHEGGIAFIDVQTGLHGARCTTSRDIITIANRGGTREDITNYFLQPSAQARHGINESSAEPVAQACISELVGRRFLASTNQPSPRDIPWAQTLEPAGVIRMGFEHPTEVLEPSKEEEEIALHSLKAALELLKQPFAETVDVMRDTGNSSAIDASPAEAQQFIDAIHTGIAPEMGKVACLQITTAAILSGAAHNRRIGATFGIRLGNFSLHTWPTAGAKRTPISTTVAHDIPTGYHPVLEL